MRVHITFGVCTFISVYYHQLASKRGLIALLTKTLETLASLPSPTTFHPCQHLHRIKATRVWTRSSRTPHFLVILGAAQVQPALWKDYLGAAVWAFRFIYEAVADAQKDVWARRRLLMKADDEPFIQNRGAAQAYYPSWNWLAAASNVPLTDRHHKKLHGNNPDYIK
ncbi:hypothetical protein BJ742DRAFT_771874 [Cladochytrium replicatum]|nr:hypothetical protein BJ742DRAFT_771874 [Cladochytrium replicatum]